MFNIEVDLLKCPDESDYRDMLDRLTLMYPNCPNYNIQTVEGRRRMLMDHMRCLRSLRLSLSVTIPLWVARGICSGDNPLLAELEIYAAPDVKSDPDAMCNVDEPVKIIIDMNAEQFVRLSRAFIYSPAERELRDIFIHIGITVEERCPEFIGLLTYEYKSAA